MILLLLCSKCLQHNIFIQKNFKKICLFVLRICIYLEPTNCELFPWFGGAFVKSPVDDHLLALLRLFCVGPFALATGDLLEIQFFFTKIFNWTISKWPLMCVCVVIGLNYFLKKKKNHLATGSGVARGLEDGTGDTLLLLGLSECSEFVDW